MEQIDSDQNIDGLRQQIVALEDELEEPRYASESCPRPIPVPARGDTWGYLHYSGIRRARVYLGKRQRGFRIGIFIVGDG